MSQPFFKRFAEICIIIYPCKSKPFEISGLHVSNIHDSSQPGIKILFSSLIPNLKDLIFTHFFAG